jgi:hypothetical protein
VEMDFERMTEYTKCLHKTRILGKKDCYSVKCLFFFFISDCVTTVAYKEAAKETLKTAKCHNCAAQFPNSQLGKCRHVVVLLSIVGLNINDCVGK